MTIDVCASTYMDWYGDNHILFPPLGFPAAAASATAVARALSSRMDVYSTQSRYVPIVTVPRLTKHSLSRYRTSPSCISSSRVA